MTPPSPIIRRRRRRPVALLAAALVSVTASLAGASVAEANTYGVYSCRGGTGAAAPMDGWSAVASPQDGSMSGCVSGSDSIFSNWYSANKWLGATDVMRWQLTAPAGTKINSMSLARSLRVTANSGDTGGAAPGEVIYKNAPTYDLSHVIEQCVPANGCTSTNGVVSLDGINADSVIWETGCIGPRNSSSCAPGDRMQAAIGYAVTSLQDDSAPSGSATSGTALDSGALTGTRTLTYSASDVGGGVYQVGAKIDGTTVVPASVVNSNGGRCAPSYGGAFGYLVPCALNVSGTLSIDTTKVPDGNHALSVTATDPAGNITAIASKTINIDNVPPPTAKLNPAVAASSYVVGTLATGADGTWEGAGITYSRQWQRSSDGSAWTNISGATGPTYRFDDPDIGSYVRLAVTAKNSEGSTTAFSEASTSKVTAKPSSLGGIPVPTPTPAGSTNGSDGANGAAGTNGSVSSSDSHAQQLSVTANNGSGGNPATARFVATSSSRGLTTKYGRVVTITGRLADADGNPIAGGKIDVFETIALPGSPKNKITTIETDDKGGYTYHPATWSTRELQFAYSATKGSTDYRDRLSINLSVKAVVKLKLSRRFAHRGQGVVFTGKVMASPLPKRGVRVVIEARDGKTWRTAKVVRTKSSGAFSWRYGFIHLGGYRLRARVLGSSDLPAKPAASSLASLRIG